MLEYKTKPYAHQARAIELSAEKEHFALLMDTGTGKSWVAIITAAIQFLQGKITQLIVLAPNGPHRDWPQHCAEHMPHNVSYVAAFYQSGYKHRAYRDALGVEDQSVLRVLSFNIEGISRKGGQSMEAIAELMRERPTLLVIDESQRIRTPSGKRTRNAWALGRLAKSRRIMSGSSVIRGLENLYAPFRFLDWAITGAKTFKDFKARHCVMVGQFNTIVGYHHVDELMGRLKPHMFQVLAEDCLDLPPRRYVKHSVELSDLQRTYYRELRDAFVLELKSGQVIEMDQVITRMLRLQQILCGHLPDPDGVKGAWLPLACPRIEQCVDLIEGTTDKVLLWARFQPDVRQLSAEMQRRKIGHRLYFGPMKEEERARHLQQWRSEREFQVLVATPQTGGVGLTLNEAGTAIFYSNSFNYEHRKQAEARNWRIGQTKPVTYHDLVVPGSIDVKALKTLEKRADTSKLLTDTREILNWLEEDTV